MGIRTTASDPVVALYDSVSGFAFGPTFSDSEQAESFLNWYHETLEDRYGDLRVLDDTMLEKLHDAWFEGQDPDE